MKISDLKIGKYKIFIIAELSANHNQDFDIAVKTIKAMKEAGADAVKLQTYNSDTITIDCDNECYQAESIFDINDVEPSQQQYYGEVIFEPFLTDEYHYAGIQGE